MTTLTDAAFLAALHNRLNKIDREIAPLQREREALQTLIGQANYRNEQETRKACDETWAGSITTRDAICVSNRDDAICVSNRDDAICVSNRDNAIAVSRVAISVRDGK